MIAYYTSGLKRGIGQALCLKTYSELQYLMTDPLRVQAVTADASTFIGGTCATTSPLGNFSLDMSGLGVEKVTPEARQRFMREGLGLRCCE